MFLSNIVNDYFYPNDDHDSRKPGCIKNPHILTPIKQVSYNPIYVITIKSNFSRVGKRNESLKHNNINVLFNYALIKCENIFTRLTKISFSYIKVHEIKPFSQQKGNRPSNSKTQW